MAPPLAVRQSLQTIQNKRPEELGKTQPLPTTLRQHLLMHRRLGHPKNTYLRKSLLNTRTGTRPILAEVLI